MLDIRKVDMAKYQEDISIFNRFGFQTRPIGVKFLFNKPDGIAKIDKKMALCEMIKEAQQKASPFYASPDDQSCKPGGFVWGEESPKVFEGGSFGAATQLFKEPRADIRIHRQTPRIDKDVFRYIAFSSLDQLPFEPDLLIILTDNSQQTEIILRAMTYTTGEVWTSKMSTVMGCSWLLAYPYINREVNYITTGFGSGMKAKKLFPEGQQIISIPYNWLPVIIQNLKEMPWTPPAWNANDLGGFVKKVYADLGLSPST
jgi:uncharacterized protein (DUF169 family)